MRLNLCFLGVSLQLLLAEVEARVTDHAPPFCMFAGTRQNFLESPHKFVSQT